MATNPSASTGSAGLEHFAPKEAESNLSPTAQFVHEVMDRYVMPELRTRGLVQTANEIAREGYDESHPTVVEFLIDCRKLEADLLEKARTNGADEKTLSIIRNYFMKLAISVKRPVEG